MRKALSFLLIIVIPIGIASDNGLAALASAQQIGEGYTAVTYPTITPTTSPPTCELKLEAQDLRFNPQDSLFEQLVTVKNMGWCEIPRFRLYHQDLWSRDSQDANGRFIEYNRPLRPGDVVTLTIDYFFINLRVPPSNTIPTLVQPDSNTPPISVPSGAQLIPEGPIRQGFQGYSFSQSEGPRFYSLIGTSSPGAKYFMRYSDNPSDPASWATSSRVFVGTGNLMNIPDYGFPMTAQSPSSSRSYQFFKLVE